MSDIWEFQVISYFEKNNLNFEDKMKLFSYLMLTCNSKKNVRIRIFLLNAFIYFGHTALCFIGFVCTSSRTRMNEREKRRMNSLSFNHVCYP